MVPGGRSAIFFARLSKGLLDLRSEPRHRRRTVAPLMSAGELTGDGEQGVTGIDREAVGNFVEFGRFRGSAVAHLVFRDFASGDQQIDVTDAQGFRQSAPNRR